MLFSSVITALAAFAALTCAESFTIRVGTSTVLECSTTFGKNSVTPIPTVIQTTAKFLTACRGTSIVTPTRTITPPPSTSTSTVTRETVLTTTNAAVTNVFSTTSTDFETITSTLVITNTLTSTSSFTEFVSETVTATVPTSPGFLPAASTTPTAYPNAVPPPRKRFMPQANDVTSPIVKRINVNGNGKCANGQNVNGNGQCANGNGLCANGQYIKGNGQCSQNGWVDAKYPQIVRCVKSIKVLTTTIYISTATTTKTTTLEPSTIVVQATTTTTSTSTVVPAKVTITSSFSTTSTVNVVTTSTVVLPTTVSTTTSVTVTSTSSLYAACTAGSGNLFGPLTPNGYIKNPVGQPTDFAFAEAPTAYDCCVKCLLSTTCAASFARTGSSSCILFKANQCSAQGLSSASYTVGTVGTGQTFTVSNSNCGYIYQQS